MRKTLCVAVLLLAGCGEKAKQSDKPITLDQVPEAAMKAAKAAAKKAYPDVNFETATLRGENVSSSPANRRTARFTTSKSRRPAKCSRWSSRASSPRRVIHAGLVESAAARA